MSKRTPEQWHKLFAAQTASGLSQRQFCKEHQLCPKHFSLRRRQLIVKPPSSLIKVQPPRAPSSSSISLHYQGIEIRFTHTTPTIIASIAKQLL